MSTDPGTTTSVELTAGHNVLDLLEPLPGLPEHTRFDLAVVPGADGLFTLRALASSDPSAQPSQHLPRLFLVDPTIYFPDYQPEVSSETLQRLGTDNPAVLVVVHPGHDGEAHAVNLLAPVLICTETSRAVQVVLDGSPWPLRAPLAGAA